MNRAPISDSHGNTVEDIKVFDRTLRRRNHARAAKNFSRHDFLFQWAQSQIADRLGDIRREFPLALQIGTRPDEKGEIKPPKIKQLISMNISSAIKDQTPAIVADEEFLPFASNTFNLVLSTLNLHAVNDLPGTLSQIRKILKPDGLFLAAMFGGETLHELRKVLMQAEMKVKGGVSPRIAPFADKQQIGALLQRAGFALPVVDSEKLTVTYNNIFKLFADLRGMGESNTTLNRSRTPPSKALFMETAKLYQEQFAGPEGRINASFEIIFMIGWASHESQQKPLRPGSAQNRLSDALKTVEIKTGEKAG